jgi:hypothetical protein
MKYSLSSFGLQFFYQIREIENLLSYLFQAQGSPFEFRVWNLMHFPFESHNSLQDSILTPVKLSI